MRRKLAAIVVLGLVISLKGAPVPAPAHIDVTVHEGTSMSVAVSASESRIRDANVAEEAANLTKYNILNQSGLAALAQANSASASVLSLLR